MPTKAQIEVLHEGFNRFVLPVVGEELVECRLPEGVVEVLCVGRTSAFNNRADLLVVVSDKHIAGATNGKSRDGAFLIDSNDIPIWLPLPCGTRRLYVSSSTSGAQASIVIRCRHHFPPFDT